jgi:DNA-binding PadR family transcriptional regulator
MDGWAEKGSQGDARARGRKGPSAQKAGDRARPSPRITSALQWALLGLVIERPGYAYELARRFNRAYEGLIKLSTPSQAYPCLDALRDHGLIEIYEREDRREDREQRRRKLYYRATDRGIAAYESHLLAQMLDVDRRERLYFRKLAVLAREPRRINALLDRFEAASLSEHQIACTRQANSRDQEQARAGPEERELVLGMNVSARLAKKLRAEARRLALVAKIEWVKIARAAIESERASKQS